MNQRIKLHPILGSLPEVNEVIFYFNGKPVRARENETIAAALVAEGIIVFRRTEKYRSLRGIFCAIGRCTDCIMTVNGTPNVRTCITTVEDGMLVTTQEGLGEWVLR